MSGNILRKRFASYFSFVYEHLLKHWSSTVNPVAVTALLLRALYITAYKEYWTKDLRALYITAYKEYWTEDLHALYITAYKEYWTEDNYIQVRKFSIPSATASEIVI